MAKRYYRRRRNRVSKSILEQFLDTFFLLIKEILVWFGEIIFDLIKTIWRKKYRIPKLEVVSLDHHVVPFAPTSQAPGALYSLKQSPMTQTETDFLAVLERVVAGRYRILPQVALSALVRAVNTDPHKNYGDFNRIKAKSIDYVLYDSNYRPYLAIELDDRSHLKLDRILRDQFVNNVMQNVGLRILHVQVRSTYDEAWLKEQIFLQFRPLNAWVRKK